jgi:bacterioferritin
VAPKTAPTPSTAQNADANSKNGLLNNQFSAKTGFSQKILYYRSSFSQSGSFDFMSVKVTTEYIDLLNKAVEREIGVSLQYMLQHAKMEKLIRKTIPENILLDKTTYDAIGKFLREIAIQEMKHAATIMERIYYLGAKATTKSSKVTVGDSLSEFAKLGVTAEEEALTLYRQIIEAAAKMGDWETREVFEKIYGEEEVHLFKFQEYTDFQDEKDTPSKVPLPEWRKVYTDDYFVLLNKAVAAEITGIVQYTNQHEKAAYLQLRKKNTALETVTETNKADVVSKLLKGVFMQEMDHLEKISERIYLLEGETVAKPDPLPVVGETAQDFLELDHALESSAISLYRQIIAEALKRGDTTTRRMFEDIVIQEEEHFWMFDDFVK